jgi:hypothetical protein
VNEWNYVSTCSSCCFFASACSTSRATCARWLQQHQSPTIAQTRQQPSAAAARSLCLPHRLRACCASRPPVCTCRHCHSARGLQYQLQQRPVLGDPKAPGFFLLPLPLVILDRQQRGNAMRATIRLQYHQSTQQQACLAQLPHHRLEGLAHRLSFAAVHACERCHAAEMAFPPSHLVGQEVGNLHWQGCSSSSSNCYACSSCGGHALRGWRLRGVHGSIPHAADGKRSAQGLGVLATTGGGFDGSAVEVEEVWQTRRWSEWCTCAN